MSFAELGHPAGPSVLGRTARGAWQRARRRGDGGARVAWRGMPANLAISIPWRTCRISRAAARTLSELQLAGVPLEALAAVDRVGLDLAALARRLSDEAARGGRQPGGGDDHRGDAAHRVARRAARASRAAARCAGHVGGRSATARGARGRGHAVPRGGSRRRRLGTKAACAAAGGVMDTGPDDAPAPAGHDGSARARLQRWLFAPAAPPVGTLDDTVQIFSAPGEGREAVEVVRRGTGRSRRRRALRPDGRASCVRRTRISVCWNTPSRGPVRRVVRTRHPAPGPGRLRLPRAAGLCRRRALGAPLRRVLRSATGAVGDWPHREAAGAVPSPDAEVLLKPDERVEDPAPIDEAPAAEERDGARVVAGTLRAPWRWEELLVEAYVIEGLERWQRRLPGLRHEYDRRWRELVQGRPGLAAPARHRTRSRAAGHLESFALPIVAAIDAWRAPAEAAWLRSSPRSCRARAAPAGPSGPRAGRDGAARRRRPGALAGSARRADAAPAHAHARTAAAP